MLLSKKVISFIKRLKPPTYIHIFFWIPYSLFAEFVSEKPNAQKTNLRIRLNKRRNNNVVTERHD